MSKLEEIQYKIKMLKKLRWYKDKGARFGVENRYLLFNKV